MAELWSAPLPVVLMPSFQWNYLRFLGLTEGISLLFMLLIAMPLRSMTQDSSWVSAAGAFHGIFFLMYAYTLIDAALTQRMPWKFLWAGLLLSCLPLGAFWYDRRYLRREQLSF